jgi:GDP-4-dehydro-6-deoxy-D-mannose reductase
MTQRVLVTGAEGFVGRVLCRHLRQSGVEVFGSDRTEIAGVAHHRACDVSIETQVRELVNWAAPVSCVYHLAAMTFVPTANKSPAAVIAANLEGTIHLACALHETQPGARLLCIGSAECYGPPATTPTTEDHPLNPGNPYAISKAAADQFCAFYHRSSGANIVRVRPFNHSGAGQSEHFVLPSFAKQIAEIEAGLRPHVIDVGDLSAARDFLHVNDVVRAYASLAEKGRTGEAYNVASGKAWTIQDALDQLLKRSTQSIQTRIAPDRIRPVDVPIVLGSHEKLTRETGWKPEIPFETILDELLAYWRSQVTKH